MVKRQQDWTCSYWLWLSQLQWAVLPTLIP